METNTGSVGVQALLLSETTAAVAWDNRRGSYSGQKDDCIEVFEITNRRRLYREKRKNLKQRSRRRQMKAP